MDARVNSFMVQQHGFWLVVQMVGGHAEFQRRFGVPRSTMFRYRAQFRHAFGEEAERYRFPGVTVDPEVYQAGTLARLAGGDR